MSRPRTLLEQHENLRGALAIIDDSLIKFRKSGELYWLKNVAIQLRALIVYEPKSYSLKHPLLIELSKQLDFPLIVYVINPNYTSYVQSLKPTLSFSRNPLRLGKEGPYSFEMRLEEAIEKHTLFQFENMIPFKEIIRNITDKEAAHYDPTRSQDIDRLSDIKIDGYPSEYQTIFYLGKVTLSLGYKLIDALTKSIYMEAFNAAKTITPKNNTEELLYLIATLEQVLKIWTKDHFPKDHAGTCNTLGLIHLKLGVAQGTIENLLVAERLFREVLTIISLDDEPEYYGLTQYNLGLALGALQKEPIEIHAVWLAAKRGFEQSGNSEYLSMISQKLIEIQNFMGA